MTQYQLFCPHRVTRRELCGNKAKSMTQIERNFLIQMQMIFNPKNFPFWIVLLNYISLSGILLYPFIALVNYARSGDYTFYQPISFEYLIIYTYPAALIFISLMSYKIFYHSKIISAILPITVLILYWLFIRSELFLKIIPTHIW